MIMAVTFRTTIRLVLLALAGATGSTYHWWLMIWQEYPRVNLVKFFTVSTGTMTTAVIGFVTTFTRVRALGPWVTPPL